MQALPNEALLHSSCQDVNIDTFSRRGVRKAEYPAIHGLAAHYSTIDSPAVQERSVSRLRETATCYIAQCTTDS